MRVKSKRSRRPAAASANELALSLSISRKVNLGNFESCDVFVSVSGITPETTEAQIDDLLAVNGALAYAKLRADVARKLAKMDADEWDRVKAEQAIEAAKPPVIPVHKAPENEKKFAGRR